MDFYCGAEKDKLKTPPFVNVKRIDRPGVERIKPQTEVNKRRGASGNRQSRSPPRRNRNSRERGGENRQNHQQIVSVNSDMGMGMSGNSGGAVPQIEMQRNIEIAGVFYQNSDEDDLE